MRWCSLAIFAAFALFARPVRADLAFIELTPTNIDTVPFEFTFSHSATKTMVEIRPREMKVSEICKQIGGRLYHCQEDPERMDLNMNDMGARQLENSLVYTLRRAKGSCLYFWFTDARLPGGEVYWISLDSPLVRDPKHQRR